MTTKATMVAVLAGIGVVAAVADAVAAPRLSLDLGVMGGVARDVQPVGSNEFVSGSNFGAHGRAGIMADYLAAGVAASRAVGVFAPSAGTLGLYAGPALPIRSHARIELLGALGYQFHDGFGSENFPSDVQRHAGVTLPYAGAQLDVWFPVRASSTLVGVFVEGRTDLAAGTGSATLQPHCWSLIQCVVLGEPKSFDKSYAVGGKSVFTGIEVRFAK